MYKSFFFFTHLTQAKASTRTLIHGMFLSVLITTLDATNWLGGRFPLEECWKEYSLIKTICGWYLVYNMDHRGKTVATTAQPFSGFQTEYQLDLTTTLNRSTQCSALAKEMLSHLDFDRFHTSKVACFRFEFVANRNTIIPTPPRIKRSKSKRSDPHLQI